MDRRRLGGAVEALNLPRMPGIVMPVTDNRIGPEVDWTTRRRKTTRPTERFPPSTRTATRFRPSLAGSGGTGATLTGWNLYRGLESELLHRDGTYAPFPKTRPNVKPPATRACR